MRGMPILYVDVSNPACSDAVTYPQAQNPATPLCSLAPSSVLALPGDVVRVKAGKYVLASTWIIGKSGGANQPITYSADPSVVVVGPTAPGAQGVVVSGAAWVVVEGFEIQGSNETGLRCSSCSNVTLRRNRVHDNGRGCSTTTKCGQGIASNSATNVGVVIEENVSYHNGSGTSLDHCYYVSGSKTVIRNNVAFDCAAYGFQIYPACHDCDVYNNVAAGMTVQAGFVLGGEAAMNETSTNMRVQNNISANNAREGFLVYHNGSGGISFVNNLAFGNKRSAIAATDPGSIFTESGTLMADPSFVDPAGLDFHLRVQSPAIDTGSLALFAPTDIDGEPRPMGAGVDIGVDEYTSTPNADAGSDASVSTREGGAEDASAETPQPGDVAGGCTCSSAPSKRSGWWPALVLAALLFRRRQSR